MKVTSYIYESRIEINFKPNLAFLFFTNDNLELVNKCYEDLKKINPDIEVIGVNGENGNINNNIPFIISNTQISLLLFKCDNFFVKTFNLSNMEFVKTKFLSNYHYYKNSATIIFFPFEYDTNNFLDYIQDEEDMYNIYGGVYHNGDGIGCFYNGEFYEDKFISVFFDQKEIEFFSIAIQGWKPIGIPFKVTKSDKNIVYEIDNEPALKIIEEYIGVITNENIDKFIHPFCVKHKDSISLASIKSVNRDENTIEFYKYIYTGEEIKVTIPVNQKNIMDLIEKELKYIQCDGLFMFSCLGRYAYYKDLLEFEISKISDYLKVPFAGFLTYGEIGSNSVEEKSILQNQTMNLVFFRKRK